MSEIFLYSKKFICQHFVKNNGLFKNKACNYFWRGAICYFGDAEDTPLSLHLLSARHGCSRGMRWALISVSTGRWAGDWQAAFTRGVKNEEARRRLVRG